MELHNQIKEELKKILGREPSCSRLKNGKFMADYFKFGAKPIEFIAESEEAALQKLLDYLKKNNTPEVVTP